MKILTVEKQAEISTYVRSHWGYNPVTGVVTGRGGRPIGSPRKDRVLSSLVYIPSGVTSVLLHRAAWFLMTGEWPANQIDHRDGIRSNNVWSNLRAATQSENGQNLNPSTHGGRLRGATKDGKRWKAQIVAPGKIHHHLGMFDTEQEAHEAYCKAKAIYHPFQPEQRTTMAPPCHPKQRKD